MDGLRAEPIDIRLFPLGQLAKFIEYVVLYQPKDVKVFFNYIVTAFDTGFFKLKQNNFVPLTQIFVMFVKNGFLSSD